jgi:hypothetical protein
MLMKERKTFAIICDSRKGPAFGYGGAIVVSDKCDSTKDSHTWGDNTYTNQNCKVYTGAHEFIVKEIEVFEIAN